MNIRSTRFRWLLALCLLVASGGLLPKSVRAEIRTAAALTPEAVGAAICAAKDGDTVQLPAGTAVWSTKSWNTGHSPKVKTIIIQGAGIDQTIITVDKSKNGNTSFNLEGTEGKPFRVTGITLDGSLHPNEASWGALMNVSGTCKNFRIDQCKFKNCDVMLMIGGDTYGLIDHCHFDGEISHGGCLQPIYYSGPGAPNYRKPLTLGTAEAMYFEDNEVNLKGAVARGDNPFFVAINAARVVIRHNTIVNAEIEIYGPGQRKCGCQSAEIYDNQFATVDGGRPGGPIFINAGVALVFNNTVTGYDGRFIELQNHRAYMDMPPWGKADGKNPLDGNQVPAGQVGAGYPCFGQVGWASNVDGAFKLTPCYAWNNTRNGARFLMAVTSRNPNVLATIKEGREFLNEPPPADYYKPYVYPHPLQEGWEALMKSVAGAAAFAATPVDIYQDMQSGANGDVLTPALMNASHHGGGKWSSDKGELWVSTAKLRDLPGPVSVGRTTYAAKGAGRCWMVHDDKSLNAVTCTLPGPCRKITLACYYTPGVTISFGNQFDTIVMSGNHGYAVLQTRNDDGKGPYFRAHSCTTGWKTTFSPGQIRVLSGKTYWVNLHFDAEQGETSAAAFDPDNNFAQVGEVVVANSWLDSTGMRWIGFGRTDNHGPNPTAKTQSYFQQILIDYTRGAFPLIPGREAPKKSP
jgi:hypothetical protein